MIIKAVKTKATKGRGLVRQPRGSTWVAPNRTSTLLRMWSRLCTEIR